MGVPSNPTIFQGAFVSFGVCRPLSVQMLPTYWERFWTYSFARDLLGKMIILKAHLLISKHSPAIDEHLLSISLFF